jgi:uncharacterized membrane protein YidH (DUF202 family)
LREVARRGAETISARPRVLPVNLEAEFYMATFIKLRKGKRKQSSFTTLHGILLSLAIAVFVGIIFVLVAVYYHSPPD